MRLIDFPPPSHDQRSPGDCWFVPWEHEGKHFCPFWKNCNSPHLVIVLPDGSCWDIDSRAWNCTMKDDKTHRCWVRHGDIPNVTVDKNGHTCQAGAGSIQMHDWHGFLRNGVLVEC